jgi:ABC-type multidrug transport system ATPase subunit
LATDELITIPVLESVRLTKVYARALQPANRDISIRIEPGEIFGILGDNGAGKTTLVRQLVGLEAPTSGQVYFRGRPVSGAERDLTTQVGYMPQSAFALNNLTVSEALYFASRFRGLDRMASRAESRRQIEIWGLHAVRRRVAKRLSGGERRLLQLAVTMAADPPILVLDEPTANLDPVNRRLVWDRVRSANGDGTTVVFVTHDAAEAEKVLRRVAILRGGEIAAIGYPSELKRELDMRLRLQLTWDPRERPDLPDMPGEADYENGTWHTVVDKAEVGSVLSSVDLAGFQDVQVASATLEDLYLHYVAQK